MKSITIEHFSGYEKLLVLLFVLTLPLVNPWVRGDGVGYYAYLHAMMMRGDLRFEQEWLAGNTSFIMNRVDSSGHLRPTEYTRTGHLDNHFTVGPAMLWAPFVVPVHFLVRGLDHLGAQIPADGYSRPELLAMALATALYGFLGLFLAFRLARKYFEEKWAFLATLGIWFGSSLPVYMYFNPSWSHAHSAFVVALFLWYWDRTRSERSLAQWIILGLIGGLMVDVYYPNGVLLLVPLLESLGGYWQKVRTRPRDWVAAGRLLGANLVFLFAMFVALLPTLITRQIIYGSPWRFGAYTDIHWNWATPALWSVLFSADHGLLAWTPILVPAILGLFLLWRQDRDFAAYLLAGSVAFYYLIASFETWDGLSSFGNRFFVSLTPIFVIGLAAALDAWDKLWQRKRAAQALASAATALFITWNLGFIFQWGTHLIPARGPISWREMAYNQVAVVPRNALRTTEGYMLARQKLMERIEQEDVHQLEQDGK